MTLPTPDEFAHWAGQLTGAAIAGGIAVAAALLVHLAIFAILRRIARFSQLQSDAVVFDRLYQPARWSLVAVAISLAAEANPALAHLWDSVARFVVPALLGWITLSLVRAFAHVLETRAELSSDELSARSRRTRVAIFSRTITFVIIFVTVALMLLGIPGVRNVGATLLASAGLAGLAVGAAAQPALKSLIAGIQMAVTEPIRLGDLVVIDGESGRVEDIRMSYVVIRTPDERRLIVPTIKFLETTFQNWTRVAGGITGSVVLPIAAGQPIAPIRQAFERILAERPEWDKRTGALHVSEARIEGIELRLVMSAAGPTDIAELRFAVREAMIEWLREEMPDALKGRN